MDNWAATAVKEHAEILGGSAAVISQHNENVHNAASQKRKISNCPGDFLQY